MTIAWTGMEQKYPCSDQQVLKESQLTCYFGSSQKKRATQPTQQALSKLRLFSCRWLWEKRNSLFSLLCIDRAAPHVVLQWSSGHRVHFLYSLRLPCFFAQRGIRSAPGSNCTSHQFRSGNIQEIRSYSHYAFLWSKLFGVWSTFY